MLKKCDFPLPRSSLSLCSSTHSPTSHVSSSVASAPTTSSFVLGPLIASSTTPLAADLDPHLVLVNTLRWEDHKHYHGDRAQWRGWWWLSHARKGLWWDRDCAQRRGVCGRMKKMNGVRRWGIGWIVKDEEEERGEAMVGTLLAVMAAIVAMESGGAWRRMQSWLWRCRWIGREGR